MEKIILLACISLFFLGCGNFLDINPESEVVNDDMFSTAEGVEDALYGVYMSMVKEDMYGGDMSVLIPELLGQNFVTDDGYLVYVSRLDNENSYARNMTKKMWPGSYLVISYLNNIIENLDQKSVKDFKYYDLYRGEALGLRATIHFDLLRLFAVHINSTDENAKAKAIPYVTKYTFKVTPFSSVEEVYEKIIADLKEAETCLVEDETLMPKIRKGGEKGFTGARELHFNLYAAQAMLARVYWMKGDLKTAAEYAQKVLDCGYFELADKSEIEDLVNGVLSPKETIWGLFSATFYTNVRANLYLTGSSSCLFLKSDHDDTYLADKEGTDYRYEKWFKNYSAIEASGMRCVKILDTYELTYSTRPDARVKGINMLRLPELYYIITEYYLSLENQDEAVKYFDKVLQSRGLTGYADRQGATLTLEKVIQERRKELICEGQYFFTQKRYNQSIYEPKSGKLYPASNDIYVFPLPENETEYRY